MNKDNYFRTREGKAVKEFIEKPVQEAVVYSVIQKTSDTVLVKCFSPVFGKLELIGSDIDVQRGDILLLAREKSGYRVIENKNIEQTVNIGLNKIFQSYNFTKNQTDMIMKIASERQK